MNPTKTPERSVTSPIEPIYRAVSSRMKPQQAVRQRGAALEYASEELRGDKEVVQEAVA